MDKNINLLYEYIELGLTVRQLKIILAYIIGPKRIYVATVFKIAGINYKKTDNTYIGSVWSFFNEKFYRVF